MPTAEEVANQPSPAASWVVEFIQALSLAKWPADEVERTQYLKARDVSVLSDPEETGMRGLIIQRVAVPIPDVSFATVSIFEGRFLGLTLHLYSSPLPDDPESRHAFVELRDTFNASFGAGKSLLGSADPPMVWHIGELDISTHFSSKRESGVMLSIENKNVAEIAEQSARPQATTPERKSS